MIHPVTMPQLGLTMDEGTFLRFVVEPGSKVEPGDDLVEVETDKITTVVPATAGGYLRGITAREGETYAVGAILAFLSDAPDEPLGVVAAPGESPAGPVRAPEAVARSASTAGAVPLSSRQRVVADRLTRGWAVPQYQLSRDVDVAPLLARSRTAGVGLTAALLHAVAASLAAHAAVNAHLTDAGLLRSRAVHLGVAVARGEDLIVPVIRDADRLEASTLAARLADLVERARSDRLRPDDVSGATFSVSSLGSLGVDRFGALLEPPMVGILAVGRVREVAVARAGSVQVAPQLNLTVTLDHRAVNGAQGAAFLADLTARLEA